MSLLFETIRLEDGKFHNLEFHNQRFNSSRKILFGSTRPIHLEEFLDIPAGYEKGLFKCRVTYSEKIDTILFEPYVRRPVASLQLVEDNLISYSHKFTDRTNLSRLYEKRHHSDDILIVKNGFLTDTSFSNIIFRLGMTWVTPAQPLLCGTMRAKLIHCKAIKPENIPVSKLSKYEAACLINAMLPFEMPDEIPIGSIRF